MPDIGQNATLHMKTSLLENELHSSESSKISFEEAVAILVTRLKFSAALASEALLDAMAQGELRTSTEDARYTGPNELTITTGLQPSREQPIYIEDIRLFIAKRERLLPTDHGSTPKQQPLDVISAPDGMSDLLGKASDSSPSRQQHKLRGCPGHILDNWQEIAREYGDQPNGHQVLRVLKRKKDLKTPKLKTVQNALSSLRKKKMIP